MTPHGVSLSNIAAFPDDLFEGANVLVVGYPGIVGNEYLVR